MPINVTAHCVVLIKANAKGARDSLGCLFEHEVVVDGQELITYEDGSTQIIDAVDDSILNGHQSYNARRWN